MTQELEDAVRPLLRPTEELRNVLPALTERLANDIRDSSVDGIQDALHKQKVLAVISHRDEEDRHEQGCLLIYKFKSEVPSGGDLVLQHAFPINGSLSLSMAQTRHSTIDLGPSNSQSALSQSRAELSLSIKVDSKEPVVLLTHDVQGLRSFLAECKRLKAEAEEDESGSSESYPWMRYYTTKHIPISLLSRIPSDLRIVTKPLHTRLSAASAGLPGDDIADIELIREEWVRAKAEEFALKDEKVRQTSLRIRIGTFNVNGKLPSQDLSPWVRGVSNSGRPATLPPLKPISPLSMGEHNGILDHGAEKDQCTDVEVQSIQSNTTTVGSTSTSTSETTSVSTISTQATSTASSNVNVDSVDKPSDIVRTSAEGTESDPDLLVFGFQELDLSTEALLYSSKTTREEAWCTAILAGLGEKGVLYEKLASKQLVGMLLVVIVKREQRENFRDIQLCAVGAGLLGIMGNKGGTAIRVTYVPPTGKDSSVARPVIMTFVDAHLAAFDEMTDRRNADFHDLSKRLFFDVTVNAPDDLEMSLLSSLPISIYESDMLFWMGDLNYRIDLSDGDVRSLLQSEPRDRNINALLDFDQLKSSMKNEKAFVGFTEHPITRLPTYRFSAGLLTDSLGYDMKRKPAWTDRILYMTSPSATLNQESYAGHPEITFSDHRPVSADFQVVIPFIDDAQFQSGISAFYHEVANMEDSEQSPKVKLENTLLEFGPVSYEKETRQVVTLHNAGQIPGAFRFVPLESHGSIHPTWLKIAPMTGLLLPGENNSITVTVHVDKKSAHELNHFITVHGEYQPTCFGTKLSDLVRLPWPIREFDKSDNLLPEGHTINAPREVMRLINWLMTHATETPDLFLTPGNQELVASIRESLDTGADFIFKVDANGSYDHHTKMAFGETLLQFLDSLVDPVVPPWLYPKCLQIADREEAFEVLGELPSESVNVWISLTAFLHFISQQAGEPITPSKAELLAAIFAPILLRDNPSTYPLMSPAGKRRFLLFFIQ